MKINAELELPLRDGIPAFNHDATDRDDENDAADNTNKSNEDEPRSTTGFVVINATTGQAALPGWPSSPDPTVSINDFATIHGTLEDAFSDLINYPADEPVVEPVVEDTS
ncbi:hypothetical protein ALUC_80251S [Aspergillus luchuensis]|nr:hypothetical protein ALUC_80251S [Aspergillus luchuensis]